MPENDAQHTPETVTPETAREKFAREQEAWRQGLKKFGITPGFLKFAASPKPQTPPAEPATPGAEWKDFERGQVSRRAALKKMGVTTGMAVFALFSVDDLARMVGKEMERRAKDNKIAGQIARELREAGVAVAGGPSWLCGDCGSCTAGTYQTCKNCFGPCSGQYLVDQKCSDQTSTAACNDCCNTRNPGSANAGDAQACQTYSRCGIIDFNKKPVVADSYEA